MCTVGTKLHKKLQIPNSSSTHVKNLYSQITDVIM